MASDTYVHPLDDLVWLYHVAASDQGFAAQQYGPSSSPADHDELAAALEPGWVSAPSPTKRQLQASRNERHIREALRCVSHPHQALLDACYGCRWAPWLAADTQLQGLSAVPNELASYRKLARDFGIAAGAVLRLRRLKADTTHVHVEVRGAHAAYLDARKAQRDRWRVERAEARAKGQAKRELLLAEMLGAPPDERYAAAARALLAELGVEVDGSSSP